MTEPLSQAERTLVANCVELWSAGEMGLKPLAAHYRTVISSIAAAESLSGALWRDEMVGGPFGPARSTWEYLAETTIRMLRETADNLEATGDALVVAAEMYEDAENINAEAIRIDKAAIIKAESYDPAPATKPGAEPR